MFSQGYILWQTIQNSTLAPSSFTSFRPPFFPMQEIVVSLMRFNKNAELIFPLFTFYFTSNVN